MKQVFICKIKIIGSPFCVLTEDEAKEWVAEDPKMNYYETVPVRINEKSVSQKLKEIWQEA